MTAMNREPIYSEQLIDTLAEIVAGGITADQIRYVLIALDQLALGDPVGTVRVKNDGHVAVRVIRDGVIKWRVTAPDGTHYNDMSPTLDWPTIHTPTPDEAVAGGVRDTITA